MRELLSSWPSSFSLHSSITCADRLRSTKLRYSRIIDGDPPLRAPIHQPRRTNSNLELGPIRSTCPQGSSPEDEGDQAHVISAEGHNDLFEGARSPSTSSETSDAATERLPGRGFWPRLGGVGEGDESNRGAIDWVAGEEDDSAAGLRFIARRYLIYSLWTWTMLIAIPFVIGGVDLPSRKMVKTS